MTQEHKRTFGTGKRAGCSCGFVATATAREGANRRLIRHIINPQAPGKVADTPSEHDGCKIEPWSLKWGICVNHSVYVDLEAGGVEPEQTALTLTLK